MNTALVLTIIRLDESPHPMRREEATGVNTYNGEWCGGKEPGEGTVREVMEHWAIKFHLGRNGGMNY